MKKAIPISIFMFSFIGFPTCTAYAAPDSSIIEPLPDAGVKLPDAVPKDAVEAVTTSGGIIKSAKTKNWWAMSAGIIWLAMFIMKILGIFRKIGKRWAYLAVGLLSMAAMLFAKFGGGASWEAAVVVMTSGPFMAFANDFVKRGVFAKEPSSSIRKKK